MAPLLFLRGCEKMKKFVFDLLVLCGNVTFVNIVIITERICGLYKSE